MSTIIVPLLLIRFQISSTTQSRNLTTAQFQSQPLAVFINDNDETNYDIAKSICEFFDARDTGTYAAIVSDTPITRYSFLHTGKRRYAPRCRGKYIMVWKQAVGTKFRI